MKSTKVFFLFFLPILYVQVLTAQNLTESEPVVEGKKLYLSEMASWNGTDMFLEKHPEQKPNIGGYFSYINGNEIKCIFFSKETKPKVIATITFDTTFNVYTANMSVDPRDFTAAEKDIYTIRKIAMAETHYDTLFKVYKGTNLNLVPLIEGNVKKVYILTGPENAGVVIFGNDYLLTFDKDNNLVSKKHLHQNMIPVNFSVNGGSSTNDTTDGVSFHTHLPETGDGITATDVCTLMLYERYTDWKQHYIVGHKTVSIWDCNRNQLFSLSKEAWDRIYKDQAKRHPANK